MENVFQFEQASPAHEFAGGTLHRATKQRFPALRGLAIQALHLRPGAVREPHVHPNAEQLDYCVSGRAQVGIVGPEGERQLLDLNAGDISFVPQGYAHWIENVGEDTLHFLVVLSHEEPETIELSEILAGVPRDTLARALGVSAEAVKDLPEQAVMIGDGVIL
jgi:oxalate decarboxylase/phosphoglucose isomerase-like protein (cupin superfamily)